MKHTLLNLNEGSFPIKLDKKLKEFEQLKANVSFLAGQIALLQELVKCTCDGDCECQTG